MRPARTLIFYEAPHRLLETLADLESVFGPQLRIAVARELTNSRRVSAGTVAMCAANSPPRFASAAKLRLLVEVPRKLPRRLARQTRRIDRRRVARMQAESGIDEKEALKRPRPRIGQSKRSLSRASSASAPRKR